MQGRLRRDPAIRHDEGYSETQDVRVFPAYCLGILIPDALTASGTSIASNTMGMSLRTAWLPLSNEAVMQADDPHLCRVTLSATTQS